MRTLSYYRCEQSLSMGPSQVEEFEKLRATGIPVCFPRKFA
jgi:hypothetical protein